MASFREIKARLGSAALLLVADMTPQAHSAMSRLQAGAVAELVSQRRDKLGGPEMADLASFAISVKWASGDLEKVLQVFSDAAAPSMKKRRVQQDFRMISQYFTADEWSRLASQATARDAKLNMIMGRAFALGLRTPSEPTLKHMNSFWLLVAEQQNLCVMDNGQKAAMLHYVKTGFDSLRRRDVREPLFWFDELPQPLDLLSSHPMLFKGIFMESLPVPPTEETSTSLVQLEVSYGCRGRGKHKARAPHR